MITQRKTYFRKFEFINGEPHPVLLTILWILRDRYNTPITITDSGRTFREHSDLYKKKFPNSWQEKITWDSRHLPSIEHNYIRAVDFKLDNLKPEIIKNDILDIAKNIGIFVGIGVGKNFIHLDIDREQDTVWKY